MEREEMENTIRQQQQLLKKKDKTIASLCKAISVIQRLFIPNIQGDISTFTTKPIISQIQKRHCLFPLEESLHGSFAPKTFKLSCGHTFHLLCLFETIQRRECRKVIFTSLQVKQACGECWTVIEDNDQTVISQGAKKEKKEIVKYSHSLATQLLDYKISSTLLTNDR
ncbi:hypothetical protein BdWA1_000427 [Babesia duncani]|uniref:Uncharacterized protein n=1 Tax=Babesia duncani TaxID=323732 RepID=A0AAD9UQ18_9APIC|nr:hypothetical protein BdWA1_000427 [Babesia duncani]